MQDRFDTRGGAVKDAGFKTGFTGDKPGFEGSINYETGCIDTASGAKPMQDVNKGTAICCEIGEKC